MELTLGAERWSSTVAETDPAGSGDLELSDKADSGLSSWVAAAEQRWAVIDRYLRAEAPTATEVIGWKLLEIRLVSEENLHAEAVRASEHYPQCPFAVPYMHRASAAPAEMALGRCSASTDPAHIVLAVSAGFVPMHFQPDHIAEHCNPIQGWVVAAFAAGNWSLGLAAVGSNCSVPQDSSLVLHSSFVGMGIAVKARMRSVLAVAGSNVAVAVAAEA
jgi:hypothetical protein